MSCAWQSVQVPKELRPKCPASRAPPQSRSPSFLTATLDPVLRKRGLARAELLSWWPDIVGEAYAGHTSPERIRWPRDGTAATLFVRCDPAMALQFSYETDRVRERLNGYFGYAAVGALRIIQQRPGKTPSPVPPAAAETGDETSLGAREGRLAGLDGPLQDAMRALGRAVLSGS